MKMSMSSMAGLAVLAIGALSAAPMAQAVTAEVRVVSAVAHYDDAGELVDPNSGWWGAGTETGTVEIGSAYGAPTGLGREAAMLDTPTAGDTVRLAALTQQEESAGAFPDMLEASPDLRLGFWLYVSNASTSGSNPVLEGWIGVGSGGQRYEIATFEPIINGYDQRDTWMYVDVTDPAAIWSVRNWKSPSVSQEMTWEALIDYTNTIRDSGDDWGTFQYGLSFQQGPAVTFSAIDGVTVSTDQWSSVTDFELRPTSGPPLLDDCKNNAWKSNYPSNTFKNQGACIAAIVANN